MVWLKGFADAPKGKPTDPWGIVDANDQPLAKFNHVKFFRILDGAEVIYTDDDDDGWAENVQAADTVARYAARAGVTDTASVETLDRFHTIVMTALLDANDASAVERDNALRRLRGRIDRLEINPGA